MEYNNTQSKCSNYLNPWFNNDMTTTMITVLIFGFLYCAIGEGASDVSRVSPYLIVRVIYIL